MSTNNKQSIAEVANSSEQEAHHQEEELDNEMQEYYDFVICEEEEAKRVSSLDQKRKNKFAVSANTKVGWGKLKGQPHSAFLAAKNRAYAQWVIDQGEAFRYSNTRTWLLDNLSLMEKDIGNIPIKKLSKKQIQSWLNGL